MGRPRNQRRRRPPLSPNANIHASEQSKSGLFVIAFSCAAFVLAYTAPRVFDVPRGVVCFVRRSVSTTSSLPFLSNQQRKGAGAAREQQGARRQARARGRGTPGPDEDETHAHRTRPPRAHAAAAPPRPPTRSVRVRPLLGGASASRSQRSATTRTRTEAWNPRAGARGGHTPRGGGTIREDSRPSGSLVCLPTVRRLPPAAAARFSLLQRRRQTPAHPQPHPRPHRRQADWRTDEDQRGDQPSTSPRRSASRCALRPVRTRTDI